MGGDLAIIRCYYLHNDFICSLYNQNIFYQVNDLMLTQLYTGRTFIFRCNMAITIYEFKYQQCLLQVHHGIATDTQFGYCEVKNNYDNHNKCEQIG